MKYHAEVLDFFKNKNQAKFMAWLERQSPLDQAAIMKELAGLMSQANASVGNKELREATNDLNKWADSYQEAYLEEKLAELNLEMAKDAANKAMADIDAATLGIKAYVRECIETNANNAEAMRELAQKIIEIEQKSGVYNAEEWAWLGQS